MIDKEKFKPILDGYKESFSVHWPEENFKWKAVKYFQDHWDIDAPNFGEMFDEATSKTRPMLEDQNVRARKQIISFAKMNDSTTRQMFRDLLDEDKSLSERIEKFKNKSIEMQEECNDITLNRNYQDLNAITTYLWLCYPDKYYIYKYTYIRNAAEELGLAEPVANGDVKNVIDSFELYDDICDVIQKDDAIHNLISEFLTKDCWPDKKLHITAIDILTYNSKYYKDKNSKISNAKDVETNYSLNEQPKNLNGSIQNEYQRAAEELKKYAAEANISIPDADGDINSALKYFQKTYSPEALEKLDDSNLLTSMFFTVDDNPNSLCRWLEMNKECKTYFGSISGGSSYKYGLFQKKGTGVWTTGTGKKPQELSEEQALKLGKEIRDALVNGVKIIRESKLDTVEAYEKLDQDLERTIGKQYYDWQWIHKYFSIICNDKLSCFHSTEWQEHVLRALSVRPSSRYYARSGQISMIQNYAGWCYFQFFTVFDKRFGGPREFYRISSAEGGYDYSKIWSEEGIVGIGRPGLGDLKGYIVNKGIDTEMLQNELAELYYQNDKDNAKEEAREIKRFYECGSNTVFVIINGEQLIALADHVGENYFDADAEIGNLRPVKWKFVFSAEDELPDSTKGKSTTCFQFGDEKNLSFLYNKYYYGEESVSDGISYYMEEGNVDKLDDQSLPEVENTEDAIIQRKLFEDWMSLQTKENGEPYSSETITQYIYYIERGYKEFRPYKNYSSVFQIQHIQELDEYIDYLFKAPGFDEFNKKAGNYACSCGLKKYKQFLEEQISQPIDYHTGYESEYARNRIVFGAPGTGKSYIINQERVDLLGENADEDYERVTFHPDYSYANFVGTYKPVPCKKDGNDSITYEYVPGPFMRVLVKALKNGRTNDPKPFLLIIEEINRADMAAVFGDIFQLLDRGDDNVSEYPIEASEDMRKYLADELNVNQEICSKVRIPDNMFIWATMNSADQGVFPMDTAFKRRWEFNYRGIDDSEDDLIGKYVELGEGADKQNIEWNNLRKAINKFLSDKGINEDKQLGPYFIARKIVVPEDGNEIKREDFIPAFKDKVLMYLFEDAARQRRSALFSGTSIRYSEICKNFDKKGINVFCSDIVNEYERIMNEQMDTKD